MKLRVSVSKHFLRQLSRVHKKRPQVESLLTNALRLLTQDEFFPESIRIHKLKGALKDRYAFSLTHDLRVLFRKQNNHIILMNIGAHDEVY